jgi:hypothetical protein
LYSASMLSFGFIMLIYLSKCRTCIFKIPTTSSRLFPNGGLICCWLMSWIWS